MKHFLVTSCLPDGEFASTVTKAETEADVIISNILNNCSIMYLKEITEETYNVVQKQIKELSIIWE